MQENTSSSVNGESQSQVPPGFRFHPTEEELLDYYLRKKVSYQKIDLDVICDIDLNKLEPWEIQDKCRTGSTPQNDCYFFSLKDKKYPTGTRTNRATAAGFWKATGRDKIIYRNCGRIGMRKTLVFYQGRAPHGQKSDWIMHEYRLDDNSADTSVCNAIGEAEKEEGWVVCHIFKKKNYIKSTIDCNPNSFTLNQETRTRMQNSCNGDLQTLQRMGSSCTEENEANGFLLHPNEMDIDNCYRDKFTKLPRLEGHESSSSCQNYYEIIREEMITNNVNEASMSNEVSCYINESGLTSWAALDRLIASQLNGETGSSRQLACCFNESSIAYPTSNDHDI